MSCVICVPSFQEELLAVEATGRDSPDEWDERMAHHTKIVLFFLQFGTMQTILLKSKISYRGHYRIDLEKVLNNGQSFIINEDPVQSITELKDGIWVFESLLRQVQVRSITKL